MSGLLVAGTTSDAGKSVVTTGICRALARAGVKVAPFKAQNMSNNSMVCADGEIGRAQWIQALAANAEPEAAMNPVLLKPGSDTRSQVIVLGRAVGEYEAGRFWGGEQRRLLDLVVDAYRDLRGRFDVVICEGAGSPAEINLRTSDIVNMGFARAVTAPVVVVGPQVTVNECMVLMTDKRIRHLPVIEDGALVGVISIGDCVKAVIDEQRHEIEDLRRYIAG